MNRAVDYRTDFYSLGVTFYELLTGSRPFQGRDALEWFHAHMAQNPMPPHELNARACRPALSAIVLKLLAKVAEERYQSAEGLKADLERCREALRQGAHGGLPARRARHRPTASSCRSGSTGARPRSPRCSRASSGSSRAGSPELFLVSGYSGIGKSSVVHELHKPVVQRRGFFLSGKFDQFQRDVPYATLAQAIRGLVQQLLAGTDEELARWRERLHRGVGGPGPGARGRWCRSWSCVVGKQPPLPELPPAEAQHRFNRVFRQFLGVFATRRAPAGGVPG